jgi:cytochrome c oxidase assembly protein subunit 17
MGASASKPAEVKPKKICCACPITKQARDACLPENDEEKCKYLIDAHLRCLWDVGFDV